MQVLTFSRQFPAYHPKAGQPTGFIESIVNSGVIECPEFDTGSRYTATSYSNLLTDFNEALKILSK